MTLKELTETYNSIAEQLGRPLVKGFKDKPTAEARLVALQTELTPPPMPLAATAYARSMPTVQDLTAQRARKWGFGDNLEAYNRSREAQSKMRKAKSLGDEEAAKHWHGIFRELNRNKKAKYASA